MFWYFFYLTHDTFATITRALGEGSTSVRTVKRRFQGNRGSPSTNDDQHLKILVGQNPCQNIREIWQAISISIPIISDHFKKIDEVKELDKWLLHGLSKSQIAKCFEVGLMLFLQHSKDRYFD